MSIDTSREAIERLISALPTDGIGWSIERRRSGKDDEARVYDATSMGVMKPTPNNPLFRRPIDHARGAVMTAAEARECRMCGDSDIPIDCDGLCQWCADEVDLRDDILARRKLAELEAES